MTQYPLHPAGPQQQQHHFEFRPPRQHLRRSYQPQQQQQHSPGASLFDPHHFHHHFKQQGESSALSNSSSQSDTKERVSREYMSSPHTDMGSKPSPNSFSIKVLSSQGSSGTVSSKISKRRSRVTNKTPITVLSADTSNFRAMVQKLTGIPTAPPFQRGDFHFVASSPAVSCMPPLLRTHLTRPPPIIMHSLATVVDASVAVLLPHASSAALGRCDPLHVPVFNAGYGSELLFNHAVSSSGPDLRRTLPYAAALPRHPTIHPAAGLDQSHHSNALNCGSPSLPGLWDPANGLSLKCREASDCTDNVKLGTAESGEANSCMHREANGSNMKEIVESTRSSEDYHPVDSWLSFDAGHAPKMETARQLA